LRSLDLIGRVLRNLRRHNITTSEALDEDVLDELNQGQNQIISEINTDKSVTITLLEGIDSYALTTDEETETEETTTMKEFVNYDLIGTKNGVNRVFTFPTMPDQGHAIMVFLNGVKLNRDVEYVITWESTSAYITLLDTITTPPNYDYDALVGDYIDANYFEEAA